MKDVTLIIQGRIDQECYDFYVENYKDFPVIISTWVGCNIDFSNSPNNFTIIFGSVPKESGPQNMNYQFISTLNGLNMVKTNYVVKIRGDEYYSNIEYVYRKCLETPNKIWSSPMFFRWFKYMQYHISDHVIAGTTENIKLMFETAKYNFDNKILWYLKDGKVHYYWEPEIILTRSYLMVKEPNRYEKIDGRILMKDNFDILNLDNMKSYYIKANIFKTYWRDTFTPERNYSISTIDKLFASSEKEAYYVPKKK